MEREFVYQARDAAGNVCRGAICAASAREAAIGIRQRGCFITSLTEKPTAQRGSSAIFARKADAREVAVFCRQLEAMLHAGLPLLQTLELLRGEASSARKRQALDGVCRRVRQGLSLSEGMRSFPHSFPPLLAAMVEAGENGGALEAVLQQVAAYFEKKHKWEARLQAALLYPLFVLIAAIAVVAVLLCFVLPVFSALFESMQLALPAPTRVLLAVGQFVVDFGPALALGLAAAGGLCFRLCRVPRCRYEAERCFLRAPLLGSYWRKAQAARFTRLLGTLLQSGVPLLEALDAVRSVSDALTTRQSLAEVSQSIHAGASLSSAVKKKLWLPSLAVQMIAVGEESGRLEEMLHRTAEFYEEETERTAQRCTALLEPLLTVVLGLLVGGIVIAMALPIFDSVLQVVDG